MAIGTYDNANFFTMEFHNPAVQKWDAYTCLYVYACVGDQISHFSF